MKSKLSIRLLLLLFISYLLFFSLFFFGFYIFIHNIIGFDIFGILSGILCLWLSSGLLIIISRKIKIISIKSENVIIRPFFSLKSRSYELSNIFYDDFEFETIYGKTEGIIIELSNNNSITIGSKEYSNSSSIINFIKNKCNKGKCSEIQIWTKDLKIFITIGIMILLLIFFNKII